MGLNKICKLSQQVFTGFILKSASRTSTMAIICNPLKFKGLAHDEQERKDLGLRGILPPAIRSVELQIEIVLKNVRKCATDLDRYLLLRLVRDTNQQLFYHALSKNIEEMMPYVYTPTVGEACIEFSRIFLKPRGLFLTINDLGSVFNIMGNWPEREVKAIVVTDGERILGLGDLGSNGMGIPIGKSSLYTAAARIPPSQLLPVTLDVGTDNETLLNDKFYIGVRQKRIRGKKYDEFLDEFMDAVVKRYGDHCLVQFEDFGKENAFRLLEKYRKSYCVFNDDIQGTAAVALAGIICSLKITKTDLSENKFLFFGAGEAASGIAHLLVMFMVSENISEKDAHESIWMMDSNGLIVEDREMPISQSRNKIFAKKFPQTTDLEHVIQEIRPTFLIGASTQHGAFSEIILKQMLQTCITPAIFALSNPTDKAECTAEQAYTNTEGKCIFVSGTAFPPFTLNDKTYYPSQGNNVYIFPGVALAAIACEATTITDEVFLVAAKSLSEQVTDENMGNGMVYPPVASIQKVSFRIAMDVAKFLFNKGFATHKPKPDDIESFLTSKLYCYNYDKSK